MSTGLRRMNRSSMKCGAAWLEWQKRRQCVFCVGSPLCRHASREKVKQKAAGDRSVNDARPWLRAHVYIEATADTCTACEGWIDAFRPSTQGLLGACVVSWVVDCVFGCAAPVGYGVTRRSRAAGSILLRRRARRR
jgi:hypothetical protein